MDDCSVFEFKHHLELEGIHEKVSRCVILLAEPLLTLLSSNIALLDIANLRSGWAFVQVLYELAQ